MAQSIDTIKDNLTSKASSMSSNLSPDREGEFTTKVEQQTAKIPSISWLGLAVGSMAVSAGLALFAERKSLANFVGLWAPSFMLIGIYNKLVKLEGSDRYSNQSSSQSGSSFSSTRAAV